MNYRNKLRQKRKEGQILLVTLLVLMVLAVAIVGVVIVTNRDIGQVVSNQKYEQLYNVAETELRRVIDIYGRTTSSLSDPSRDQDLAVYIQDCIAVNETVSTGFECQMVDDNALNLVLDTRVSILERKDIQDLEIYKDETVNINLAGYNQGIDFSWNQDVAMEFIVSYFVDSNGNGIWDSNEPIEEVRDTYDRYGVFDSLDPSNQFQFQALNPSQPGRGVRLIISNILSLQGISYVTRSVSVTPRTRVANPDPVLLTVEPTDPGSFPFQVREFTSSTFDPIDDATPFVEVSTQIPIESQVDSIFNYSIITDGNISL
jgi:hypothetical protein